MDRKYMQLALDEASKCVPVESAYNVGAVVVAPNGDVIARGHSRELPGNTHAEECCLIKLSNEFEDWSERLEGCCMYTTMEPCGERLSGKESCAHRILKTNIKRVVYGAREPSNFIASCVGANLLLQSGREVIYLREMEQECLAANNHLLKT